MSGLNFETVSAHCFWPACVIRARQKVTVKVSNRTHQARGADVNRERECIVAATRSEEIKNQRGPRAERIFQLTLVSGQLDPEVAFFLVGLKKGRPLNDAAQLSPSGRLKNTKTKPVKKIFILKHKSTLTGVAGAEAEGGSAASESHSELRSSLEASP